MSATLSATEEAQGQFPAGQRVSSGLLGVIDTDKLCARRKNDFSQASTVPFTPKRVDSPDNRIIHGRQYQRRQLDQVEVK